MLSGPLLVFAIVTLPPPTVAPERPELLAGELEACAPGVGAPVGVAVGVAVGVGVGPPKEISHAPRPSVPAIKLSAALSMATSVTMALGRPVPTWFQVPRLLSAEIKTPALLPTMRLLLPL